MKFLFSSLGKKIQIAFSGVSLCIFLLMHLFNNLVLFTGEDNFNSMVHFLESIKPLIRIMEFGLLIILLLHIGNALQLTWYNRKSSLGKSSLNKNDTSTLNSRTMAISGTVILLFFIIHLRYIWFTYQTTDSHEYYQILLQNKIGFLGHTPTAVFYIIAILLIGSHLKHGFQSSLKTLGVLSNSRFGILYNLSILFWAIIPGLFILIILSIQIGWIN